jgi:NADP-dependent 3-hydroxy acid dehydrogenase YdfG
MRKYYPIFSPGVSLRILAAPHSTTQELEMTDHTINTTQKVVLITGASSGIGEATARHLAAHGMRVVLGARRTERLDVLAAEIDAAGGSASVFALDVTSQDSMQRFVDFAVERHGKIDVLINNAGVMPLSKLEALKVAEWNQMIDVNIRGVLHGIAAALPPMQRQRSGQIINMASIGAYTVSPTAAVYCATKFAVAAISEGLRQEVGGDIRVTVVSPGVVESELAESISDPAGREEMRAFRQISIKPEAIARAIRFAIEQPADVDVSEIIVRPTASMF